MKYFLELFGDLTVNEIMVLILAIVFMSGCYRKVSTYFKDKAVNDYNQNQEIKKVIEQSKKYPVWRQQSIDIQKEFIEQIQALGEKVDQISCTNKEGMALTWRYRILRFNDEILHDEKHTKEHFDQLLEDITQYERYCDEHPEFPNNKAVCAINNIRSVYQKCCEEGTFL